MSTLRDLSKWFETRHLPISNPSLRGRGKSVNRAGLHRSLHDNQGGKIQWNIRLAMNNTALAVWIHMHQAGQPDSPGRRFRINRDTYHQLAEHMHRSNVQPTVERLLFSDIWMLAERWSIEGLPIVTFKRDGLWDLVQQISSGSHI